MSALVKERPRKCPRRVGLRIAEVSDEDSDTPPTTHPPVQHDLINLVSSDEDEPCAENLAARPRTSPQHAGGSQQVPATAPTQQAGTQKTTQTQTVRTSEPTERVVPKALRAGQAAGPPKESVQHGFLTWLADIWEELQKRNPSATERHLVEAAEISWNTGQVPRDRIEQYRALERLPALQVPTFSHYQAYVQSQKFFRKFGTLKVPSVLPEVRVLSIDGVAGEGQKQQVQPKRSAPQTKQNPAAYPPGTPPLKKVPITRVAPARPPTQLEHCAPPSSATAAPSAAAPSSAPSLASQPTESLDLIATIRREMAPSDASHTVEVLAAFKMTLQHLYRALGFYSQDGPSKARSENTFNLLTAESNAEPPRPSMREKCATQLLAIVARLHTS
eukprot:TRINITY_DN4879_c0_g1_i2.p1 TRINITY_DN4879_c0_g1~~TRINITY_DN4879_c0_g1_i2.p1  ORF type:complete len:389 (+),score=38.39 TRINITY_DN4879_c0_g1_i2:132-1298(+)